MMWRRKTEILVTSGALLVAILAAGGGWAGEGERTITLRWTLPGDADCAGVLIRYSTERSPADPEDGLPVPNGRDGFFGGRPGEEGSFVHRGLRPDATYHYAAFAYDEVPNFGSPARLLLAPRPAEPAPIDPPTDPLFLRLFDGSPNPFRASVRIDFEIRADRIIEADVFDAAGRHVTSLLHEEFSRGLHEMTWNGRDRAGRPAPAGIYFVRVDSGSRRETKKVVLLR